MIQTSWNADERKQTQMDVGFCQRFNPDSYKVNVIKLPLF
jgi:hypothetical protein